MNKSIRILLIAVFVLLSVQTVFAQDNGEGGAYYYVKAGDTLWTIARKLHISFEELLSVNGLTEDSSIIPGTELVIPGLGDISGVLSTTRVPYGESLESLSRRYRVSEDILIRVNRLTSPFELYAGVSAVLVAEEEVVERNEKRITLAPNQSSLELAVSQNINPWTIVLSNGEEGEWDLLPGEVFFIPETEEGGPGGFPEEIEEVQYQPNNLVQGRTTVLKIEVSEETEVSGWLGDYPLTFFTQDGKTYIALQGLHAKEDPGLKPLSISGTLSDGTPFAHTQLISVLSGNYHYEYIVSN